MAYTKHIKFIYYRLYVSDLKTRKLFSMVGLINRILRYNLKSRIEKIGEDRYRLENIETETRNNIDFYHLRFMKLDDANIPNLSYENDESVPLTLRNGQYIGTALHVLYDISNEIFMIQQNRSSMTIGKLNEYINRWGHKLNLVKDNQFLSFDPILSKKGLCDTGECTKIYMNFANIQQADVPDNTALHHIANFYNMYSGLTGCITISIGHNTSKQLNGEQVRLLSNEISNNRNMFKSAKIYYKTDDYSGFVDLIEDIMHDIIQFDIEKRTVLSLALAQEGMLKRYLSKIINILEELGIE